jgi:vacuolar-type H+-ATPase subunit I/STV1
MKISVIFGVGHMTLGLVQKGLNAHYNKDKLALYHEFVP